jgi:hypothetical protein
MAFRVVPHARELRSWSGAELQALADVAVPAWRRWLCDWSTTGDSAESCVTAASAHEAEAASREWQALGTRGSGYAWLAGGADQARRLVHWLLFGELRNPAPGCAATMAQQACATACDELLSALRGAFGLASREAQGDPGTHLWHRWSGAVELTLACEDVQLHIVLDAACVRALLQPNPAATPRRAGRLAPLSQALRTQRVALHAVLQPVELDLGSLAHLRPGDILPLEHPLDADIALAAQDGGPVLGGFLGRVGERRALQLTSTAS